MKFLMLILLPIAVVLVLSGGQKSHVFAVDVVSPACQDNPTGEIPAVCQDNQTNTSANDNPIFGPNGLLATLVNILSVIVGIVAVIVLMISGVRYITAGGDPESSNKARRGIIYAVIGIIIAASAQLVVRFILSKL